MSPASGSNQRRYSKVVTVGNDELFNFGSGRNGNGIVRFD